MRRVTRPRVRVRGAPTRAAAALAVGLALVGQSPLRSPAASPSPTSPGATSPSVTSPSVTGETLTVKGVKVEYAIVRPADYDPEKSYPVVLALPPGGQDRTLTFSVTSTIYAHEARRLGYVVVSPVAPNGRLFFDGSEKLIPGLLDHLATTYKVETGRFFLVGVSNGGISAFRVAGASPGRFRSLLVFPGFPSSAKDKANLAKLTKLPIRMFVGANDTGWVGEMKATESRLRKLGADVQLTVVPGEGHIISTLRDGVKIFETLEEQRRGTT